jgi:hypothetical protein
MLNHFKWKIHQLKISKSLWALQPWYKVCLHLTWYGKYINISALETKMTAWIFTSDYVYLYAQYKVE